MPKPRDLLPILLALPLAGCAGGAAPPPAERPVRVLGVSVDSLPPEPDAPVAAAEPEPSLEQRRAAPFAVQSSGQPTAYRGTQVVVLRPAAAEGPPPASGVESSAAPAAAPATRPAPPETPAPAEGDGLTHRVEWGETWYGIARRYGVSTAALARANPEVDPERLRSGTELRIPREPRSGAQRTHTVRAGDTLWGIAQRYGVSMERIRAANRLPDDRVRLGQTLIIPAAEEGR